MNARINRLLEGIRSELDEVSFDKDDPSKGFSREELALIWKNWGHGMSGSQRAADIPIRGAKMMKAAQSLVQKGMARLSPPELNFNWDSHDARMAIVKAEGWGEAGGGSSKEMMRIFKSAK